MCILSLAGIILVGIKDTRGWWVTRTPTYIEWRQSGNGISMRIEVQQRPDGHV